MDNQTRAPEKGKLNAYSRFTYRIALITDGERARAFYTGVLGLEFVKDDCFALVLRSKAESEEAGNMVRLVRMKIVVPAPFAILGWESKAIEVDVQRFTAAGVAFIRYSFLQQDELGIWTAPNGDKVAWFNDPDGNILSLSKH